MRERIADCQSNRNRKGEDQRDKDKNLSNLEEGHCLLPKGTAATASFMFVKCKVCVISEHGKEAIVAVHEKGDFFGEGCLSGQPLRLATVVAMTDFELMRFDMQQERFSELFIAHLLARNARVEADLVDQLFNSSEKRLASLLLLMANFGKEGKPEPVIARRDGRYYPVARERFYEQVSQVGFHRIQR